MSYLETCQAPQIITNVVCHTRQSYCGLISPWDLSLWRSEMLSKPQSEMWSPVQSGPNEQDHGDIMTLTILLIQMGTSTESDEAWYYFNFLLHASLSYSRLPSDTIQILFVDPASTWPDLIHMHSIGFPFRASQRYCTILHRSCF